MSSHYANLRSNNKSMPTCAREGEEQATLFHWVAMQQGKYPELAGLFHIPNGGKRGKAEAARFKAEGVKAGVPDLFLPCARGQYHGLFIEMKRAKGGSLSAAQKEWRGRLESQGYCWVCCHGWEDASEVIIDYMEERI